jgi:excisionase family DNA binding protein
MTRTQNQNDTRPAEKAAPRVKSARPAQSYKAARSGSSDEPDAHKPPLYYSRKGAAREIGCHITTIDRWIQHGKLKCVRINTLTRIHRDDLLALVKPHRRIESESAK